MACVSLLMRQILIFILGWISYALTYFLRKPIGVVKTDMAQELMLSQVQLGWFDTALFLPYALAQMFFSQAGDIYGARRVFGYSLVLSAFSMFTFGKWSSFPVFMCCLFLNGLFQSQCWPNCVKILLSWFPDSQRNSVCGAFGTCAFVGGVGGTAVAVYLQNKYGWRYAFSMPSALIGICGVLVLLFYSQPQESNIQIEGKEQTSDIANKDSSSLPILQIIKIPVVKELAVAVFCLKMVRYCIYMWFPMYLVNELKYSISDAGYFSVTFDVGGVVGSTLIGFIIDRCFSGRNMMGTAVSVLMSALCLLLFTTTRFDGMLMNSICMFMAGLFNCGPDTILGGAIPSQLGESNGRNAGSAVTGFVNGFGSVGTFIEGPVFGMLVTHFGWTFMFYVLIALSALSAMALWRASFIHPVSEEKSVTLV